MVTGLERPIKGGRACSKHACNVTVGKLYRNYVRKHSKRKLEDKVTPVLYSTSQWSLYVPDSGHYMYRTVVTVCTGQWSLYVPDSGHCMYRTVVTVCSNSLTFNNATFCPHSVFMCFVWIWEQTAIVSLYSINWLVFITEIWPFKAQWSLHVPSV